MVITTKTAFPSLASKKIQVDLKASISKELKDFDRLRDKFQICLNRYILMRMIRKNILRKTNYTQSWSPLFDVYKSMEGYLVISLLSFYTTDDRSIQIGDIQKTILGKSNRKLLILHYKSIYEENSEAILAYKRNIEKLNIIVNRLRSGRISEIIHNLKEWRDKEFAHIDKDPIRLTKPPDLGQIDLFVVFTASYITSIETLILGKKIDHSNIIGKSLNKANRLNRSIVSLEPLYDQWIHAYSDQIYGVNRRYGAVFFQKLK